MTNREQIAQNQRELVAQLQGHAQRNPDTAALGALNLAIEGLNALELNECRMVGEIIHDKPTYNEPIKTIQIPHPIYNGFYTRDPEDTYTASAYNPETGQYKTNAFYLFSEAENWIRQTYKEWERGE